MSNVQTNDLLVISDVKEYVLASTFTDSKKIDENTFLFKEGFFDSMGFVSLISFIEEKYQIQINDNDLVEENFESINAIAQFISSKQQ